ncbi:MAG: bifunctional proline dehydrogenase/L-glutamate gamma-semialdehyde dehydrogenase [Proteobacteria bacterium]|nr:bifunctional proline dehydrogenase/L-glutamate gamma-semialdehyde dehydrogenase [Pseudomonadota bacterium]
MGELDIKRISQETVELAESWQERANQLIGQKEKTFQSQMASLLRHPLDKAVLTRLIDQAFRSGNSKRVADQIIYTLENNKVPEFFTSWEKLLVRLFIKLGGSFSGISVPQVVQKMRKFSSQAILAGEKGPLTSHLKKRKSEGVRMNVNHLGEAVLGEEESRARLETNITDLENPAIEYISVKISTIYSQIHSLAFDHSVAILKDRLSLLYRTAQSNVFTRKNGEKVPKFVNLDMEEYRDLEITTAAFMQTLDQEEFKNHKAGIVLQAYLPDSHAIQRLLTEWAVERVKNGGSPIKIRIVKGANMEMEQVDSEINNWPLATYDSKTDVDANYKTMVLYGMREEHMIAVELGIASHNLFELAFAYQVASHLNVLEYVDFEMLEGMADHIRRAIVEKTNDVLLYAPVAEKEQFINAIAYLIRRLDENTAPDNFLRYAPNLKTGTEEWSFLKDQFYESCDKLDKIKLSPNRIQDRCTESFPEQTGTYYNNEFVNEPDTDWALAGNRTWAEDIRKKWKKSPGSHPIEIPVVIAGEEIYDDRKVNDCIDPSQYHENICVARYRLAAEQDVEKAVSTAKNDPDGWRSMSQDQRHKVLSQVAMELRKGRGDLIGAAAANTGKVFTEADVEVSEAVDFAEYYPYTVKQFLDIETLEGKGKGVGLVISPWNFPIAIPCGGIVASLAAGNTVIFKPASDSVVVAWELCKRFWAGGVPKTALQFMPCPGSSVGAQLVEHQDIDYVILTGGTDTGMRMLEQKPGLFLAAETGGKNATIVTAMSDRDQAIKNVVYSAFGNAGQKCSATSLLILEREVYEDKEFRRQLVDAAKSFSTGTAWDFKNKMGPMINPPSGELEKALKELETGENWALKPELVDDNPYIWSPGIKWDVTPGSFTHMTEFFGPVLAVMCAENLDHAIELTNQTGYGLTSGIESLDPREIEIWKDSIEAGNLYINRGTTGAITLRQPFGGMKKSAIGPAVKAGSPNYTAQFMEFKDTSQPAIGTIENDSRLLRLVSEWKLKVRWNQFGDQNSEMEDVVRAIKSYLYQYEQEFSQAKDYFNLRGQDNMMRYLPLGKIVVRLHQNDTLFETIARIAAVQIAGNQLVVSAPKGLDNRVIQFLLGKEGIRLLNGVPVTFESDEELIAAIPNIERIRFAGFDKVPESVFKAAAKTGFYVCCAPVLMEGRIELLHVTLNQSICHTYHRYGNLGERSLDIQ